MPGCCMVRRFWFDSCPQSKVQLLEPGSTLRPSWSPHSLQRPPGEAGFPGVAGDPLPAPSPCPHHLHSRQLQTAHFLSPGCAAQTLGSQLVSVRPSRTPWKQKALNVKKGAWRPHLRTLSQGQRRAQSRSWRLRGVCRAGM